MLLAVNLMLHIYFQPYSIQVLNRLETLVLFALCTTQAGSLAALLDVLFERRRAEWVEWFLMLLNVSVFVCLICCAIHDYRKRRQAQLRRKQLWAVVRNHVRDKFGLAISKDQQASRHLGLFAWLQQHTAALRLGSQRRSSSAARSSEMELHSDVSLRAPLLPLK